MQTFIVKKIKRPAGTIKKVAPLALFSGPAFAHVPAEASSLLYVGGMIAIFCAGVVFGMIRKRIKELRTS